MRYFIALLATLLFGLPTRAAAPAPERPGEVLLLATEGSVLALRDRWKEPQAVRAGTVLDTTDSLQVAPGARAVVLCPDLETVWRPPAGLLRSAAFRCPKEVRSGLMRLGQPVPSARALGDLSENILAPRQHIRETAPLLRWRPIGGKRSEYEVQIVRDENPDRAVWGPVLVKGLEIRYPSALSRLLEPGIPYRVEIRPRGSQIFYSPEAPFIVLEPGAREELTKGLKKLQEFLKEDEVPLRLAAAARLAADGVYGEALEEMDQVRSTTGSAAVLLLGARFAEQLGFLQDAARRYEEARVQAYAERSRPMEAEAFEGLARNQADHAQARSFYESARDIWSSLGDVAAADRVRKVLVSLH